MSLNVGSRLGHYDVTALIGEGGMGQVYQATDTRLDRTVAIKVLPEHVAADPDRKQRFGREARTVAALNHPNICTLYDIGNQDGIDFLVMEYLDGQTLAQRLKKSALPLDQALTIAVEIADALDAAHRRGVIHRDVKPANIMLTRSGAKLLDFGLAKFRSTGAEATRLLDDRVARLIDPGSETSVESMPDRPTQDLPLTERGEILGTFQYMAPEQVEGRDVDARTDIFAFGAVVYEMVTGWKAFEGKSRASLIGAILLNEPKSILDAAAVVPLSLERIVRRCLAKDPEERWQSVRDLKTQLRWVSDSGGDRGSQRTNASRRIHVLWSMTAVLLVAATSAMMWNLSEPSNDIGTETLHLNVAPPENETLAPEIEPSIALSPDGSLLAFRARHEGETRLYLRELGAFDPKPVPESEGAHTPFFSPDGEWLGFIDNGTVWKVRVSGGLRTRVGDAPSISPSSPGAAWGGDSIVFPAGSAGLMRVSDTGGAPEPLTVPDSVRGEVSHFSPQFLPGEQHVLFSIRMLDQSSRLAVLSLQTGRWDWLDTAVVSAGAQYVPTGHLVFEQGGGLYAAPFDPSSLIVSGTSVLVAEDVFHHAVAGSAVAQFAVSQEGNLAYVSGMPSGWRLVSVHEDAVALDPFGAIRRTADAPLPLTQTGRQYSYPRVSPDGRQLAVNIDETRSDIYVVDVDRGTERQLTRLGDNTLPAWMDNSRVSFASRRPGSESWDIYSRPADESAPSESLLTAEGTQVPSDWTPDGRTMVFYSLGNTTARDIWMWQDGKADMLDGTASNERAATFSPTAEWLAYVEDSRGQDEVYVKRFPTGARELASTNGGSEPVWSPNGRELFFRSENRLMSVTIQSDDPLRLTEPRIAIEDMGSYVPAPPQVGRANYDVLPDGETFVMIQRDQLGSPPRLRVVQNWIEKLTPLVPDP